MNHVVVSWALLATTTLRLQDAPPSTFPWSGIDVDSNLVMGVHSTVLDQQYRMVLGGQTISRTRAERADASSAWRSENEQYDVGFFLTAGCAREGGDELFLCGVTASGHAVIERWRFGTPAGTWIVTYGAQAPAIGTPAPSYMPSVVVKGGGAWRLPKIESSLSERSVLYEGSAGPFTSADVDPEGRQLLLYDSTAKSIVRIVLGESPAVIETLLDDSAYPELATVSSLEFRDFGSEGRKTLTRKELENGFRSSQEIYGILSDANNDGNIDGVSFLSHAAFDSSPYGEWTHWREFWRLE